MVYKGELFMRIGVIGINHKQATLTLRENLSKACQKYFTFGVYRHGPHLCILLNTCNRTEIYFTSQDLTAAHTHLLHILREEIEKDFDQKVYSYFGGDCFLHLARVTAGLDSAIVAETEIQGQVKTAYESAVKNTTLCHDLHYLFQKSLKIGKKIRTELSIGRGMPDLEHAIFNVGKHLFPSTHSRRILFIGASEVNCKILAFLKNKQIKDITLCNRSLTRAQTIATTYGISLLEWKDLAHWHTYDWIILGTKAPHHLITQGDLPQHSMTHKLLIDLSVPRNIQPTLAQDPRITLLNIDQINCILKVRRHHMAHLLTQAEQLIAFSAKQHLEIFFREQQKAALRKVVY
jgi:glutamyl-tRNA reductase